MSGNWVFFKRQLISREFDKFSRNIICQITNAKCWLYFPFYKSKRFFDPSQIVLNRSKIWFWFETGPKAYFVQIANIFWTHPKQFGLNTVHLTWTGPKCFGPMYRRTRYVCFHLKLTLQWLLSQLDSVITISERWKKSTNVWPVFNSSNIKHNRTMPLPKICLEFVTIDENRFKMIVELK